jgi:hypothetical protein
MSNIANVIKCFFFICACFIPLFYLYSSYILIVTKAIYLVDSMLCNNSKKKAEAAHERRPAEAKPTKQQQNLNLSIIGSSFYGYND